MKTLSLSLFLFFTITICKAQEHGTIKSVVLLPKAGIENQYIYTPPAHLAVPENIDIAVVYQNRKQFNVKNIPAEKTGNGYVFFFKAEDSTTVLIFTVTDRSKKPVDTNNDLGFISYLYDEKGWSYIFSDIHLADLLSGYAQFFLKLKQTSGAELIKKYEDSYRLHPELKKQLSYFPYLRLLYSENNETARPKLLTYAKQMEVTQNDEEKWKNALATYDLLQLADKRKILEDRALSVYPNGIIAKELFWNKYNQNQSKTEQLILNAMNEYTTRFKDSSRKTKDIFYTDIIPLLLGKPDWEAISKYELLLENKLNTAAFFNNLAWQFCGDQLYGPSTDLATAKIFSAKALAYTKEMMNKPLVKKIYDQNLQGTYNNYADTYALILFKLGEYDSAFHFQDAVYKQGNQLDEGGLERYATYVEKVQGPSLARQVIEVQLSKGVNSPEMLRQLKSIYAQLDLADADFIKLQQKSTIAARQKMDAVVKAKFGSRSAKEIVLKNLSGENVSLSSFKNKVVILDFWATWCGPCKASFPAMQETINQYRNDSMVVFLFIDCWERTTPEKMQEAAAKLMADNKYSFNVLLDINDKAGKDYQVDAIPARFIIDKTGNIAFMGESSNLSLEIENVKNR